jgi:hypothetical protein
MYLGMLHGGGMHRGMYLGMYNVGRYCMYSVGRYVSRAPDSTALAQEGPSVVPGKTPVRLAG